MTAVKKVKCPLCKAKFKWRHVCKKIPHLQYITREEALMPPIKVKFSGSTEIPGFLCDSYGDVEHELLQKIDRVLAEENSIDDVWEKLNLDYTTK